MGRLKRFSPAAKISIRLAEVVRGVGVETEVAVQEIGVGVVVELRPLRRLCRLRVPSDGRKARRLSVAMLRATSGIQLPRSCGAARDHGVRVLVAAVDGEPASGAQVHKSSETPRLSIWPRFSRMSRIGEELGLVVTADDGAIDLGEEVAGADACPSAARRPGRLPIRWRAR